MSDAEHLIENAIMALERYPYEEAERYFMEAPINIMMSKDSGCPLNAVWEIAIYCDTTLRQDWKEKWEKEAERWIPVTERLPEVGEEFVLVCVNGRYHNIKFAGAAEIAMYDEDGWWIEAYPEWKNPRVTHWMPLPDAPKEGQ